MPADSEAARPAPDAGPVLIAPEEDSLRIRVLCGECQGRIESLGTGKIVLEDPDVYLL